ncbi:MAG: SapC family protein [Paracoccaceae bacterium]
MAKQLLIYETAVPVSSERHRNLSVVAGEDYGFARDVNAVPVAAAEIPIVALEMPIVFAGKDVKLPVAIMGLQPRKNDFVDADGRWRGAYVPAFLRRYPFALAAAEEGSKLTLCLDMTFGGVNTEGRGEALFDADGGRTPYLDRMLTLCEGFEKEHRQLRTVSEMIAEMGLLEEMHAEVKLKQPVSLQGFHSVNRKKVSELDDASLLRLMKTGGAELMHLHLASIRQFKRLGDMLSEGALATAH